MKRFPFLLVSILLVLPASRASAEVCAVFDDFEVFQFLDIATEPGKGIIWSKLTARPDVYCLNILGDSIGDGIPTHTVILMPDEPLLRSPRGFRPNRIEIPPPTELANPVVVWPRYDGLDWELLYSMWDYEADAWAYSHFVEQVDNDANDILPVLKVVTGKLELTWTRVGITTQTMRSIGTITQAGKAYAIEWSTPVVVVGDPPPPPPLAPPIAPVVPIGSSASYY